MEGPILTGVCKNSTMLTQITAYRYEKLLYYIYIYICMNIYIYYICMYIYINKIVGINVSRAYFLTIYIYVGIYMCICM